MRIFVSGCAGFIGSHICDRLLANGHEVLGVDNMSGGFQENVPEGVSCFSGDVNSEYMDVMVGNCDVVIHAAAYAAEGLSPFIRRFNYENNLLGSINLINAAVNSNVKLFVFLSSIAVYGHGHTPFTEETPPMPCDPYGISKYAVELDLQEAHARWGLPYMIFRPFNVYGPRQNIGDNYRNVVGIFMNQCLKGEAMRIFGNGRQTRAFSYIDDVAPVIADAVDSPQHWNETYNIGGSTSYTINELSLAVADTMGVEYKVTQEPARQEVFTAACDTTKSKRLLRIGHQETPLHTGLLRMAEWAKAHGPQTRRKFSNIEITKGLPPSWT